jgi:hypothetical protein
LSSLITSATKDPSSLLGSLVKLCVYCYNFSFVVLQKKTKKHELLGLRRPALPCSEKNVFKRVHVYGGCTFMVSTVVFSIAMPPGKCQRVTPTPPRKKSVPCKRKAKFGRHLNAETPSPEDVRVSSRPKYIPPSPSRAEVRSAIRQQTYVPSLRCLKISAVPWIFFLRQLQILRGCSNIWYKYQDYKRFASISVHCQSLRFLFPNTQVD